MPALIAMTVCLVLTVGLSVPPGLTSLQRAIKVAAKNPTRSGLAREQAAADFVPRP